MCGLKPCRKCAAARRQSKVSGMTKRKTTRRRRRRASVGKIGLPNKITGKHLTGAAIGIAAETTLDHVAGGILTDSTGRYLKIAGGLALLLTQKNQTVQGAGLGIAVNNAYAKFLSDANMTLGDEVKALVLPSGEGARIQGAYNLRSVAGANPKTQAAVTYR